MVSTAPPGAARLQKRRLPWLRAASRPEPPPMAGAPGRSSVAGWSRWNWGSSSSHFWITTEVYLVETELLRHILYTWRPRWRLAGSCKLEREQGRGVCSQLHPLCRTTTDRLDRTPCAASFKGCISVSGLAAFSFHVYRCHSSSSAFHCCFWSQLWVRLCFLEGTSPPCFTAHSSHSWLAEGSFRFDFQCVDLWCLQPSVTQMDLSVFLRHYLYLVSIF